MGGEDRSGGEDRPGRSVVITLLTDYGLRDGFAGVLHGVIAGICPPARIIDISHGIPRQDVLAGALVLAETIPYLPVGVHVAVVDPGVGSARRAIAVAARDGRLFVGPDNGLLWPAVEVCGGPDRAVDISASSFCLTPVSATFHGRDIFAPVAAQLAAGRALGDAGGPVATGDLVRFAIPKARVEDGVLVTRVVYVDAFGNVQLGATLGDLERLGVGFGVGFGRRLSVAAVCAAGEEAAAGAPVLAHYAQTFADVPSGELILFVDSAGAMALAVNLGSAAERLGLRANDVVRISASEG